MSTYQALVGSKESAMGRQSSDDGRKKAAVKGTHTNVSYNEWRKYYDNLHRTAYIPSGAVTGRMSCGRGMLNMRHWQEIIPRMKGEGAR
jgi:hypothetical protein